VTTDLTHRALRRWRPRQTGQCDDFHHVSYTAIAARRLDQSEERLGLEGSAVLTSSLRKGDIGGILIDGMRCDAA